MQPPLEYTVQRPETRSSASLFVSASFSFFFSHTCFKPINSLCQEYLCSRGSDSVIKSPRPDDGWSYNKPCPVASAVVPWKFPPGLLKKALSQKGQEGLTRCLRKWGEDLPVSESPQFSRRGREKNILNSKGRYGTSPPLYWQSVKERHMFCHENYLGHFILKICLQMNQIHLQICFLALCRQFMYDFTKHD